MGRTLPASAKARRLTLQRSSVALLIQMRLLSASCNLQFANVTRPMDKTAGYLATTGPLGRVHLLPGAVALGRWRAADCSTIQAADTIPTGLASDSLTLCISLCCYRTTVSPKHSSVKYPCMQIMQIKAHRLTFQCSLTTETVLRRLPITCRRQP